MCVVVVVEVVVVAAAAAVQCMLLLPAWSRSLHVMVARQDDTVVDALIRRLQRDGHLHQALRIRNFQHQVSALTPTSVHSNLA